MVKTPESEAFKENVQYELIPGEDQSNYWKIRILEGDYIETVFTFGALRVDEKNATISFDYTIDYSPIEDLTPDDPGLQKWASGILNSVLIEAFDESNDRADNSA